MSAATSSPRGWSENEGRALHEILLARGAKVAAAESLTVGRVAAALGRPSGASAYFVGAITCYAIDAKVRLLGVDAAHAASVNAVSERVAREMARGAATLFDAELAVATTGYAETDAARGVDAPFAWVAALAGGSELALRVDGHGLDREGMQAAATAAALRLLAGLLAAKPNDQTRRP